MAATLRYILLSLLAASAAGLSWEFRPSASKFWNELRKASSQLPIVSLTTKIVKNIDYKLKLRICNAFPSEMPYDVFLNEVKIQQGLGYTDCFQYTGDLRSGDRVNFKVQSLQTGSFTIDTLPRQDATLLLVIMRHDQETVSAKFLSHVYADFKHPQVAVLDAYQGAAKSNIQLASKGTAISEDAVPKILSADSVTAINEGAYQITLGEAREKQKKYEFNAWEQEVYVVIRCGMKSAKGKSYTEELLVYPRKAISEPTEAGNVTKTSNISKADTQDSQKAAASAPLPSFLLLMMIGSCACSGLCA